ncbi:Fatty acid amide hydrolase [Paramyrothecium foliicola]|nr:Fatty acid amide hydrolase [Paramyrothecium foliicola]
MHGVEHNPFHYWAVMFLFIFVLIFGRLQEAFGVLPGAGRRPVPFPPKVVLSQLTKKQNPRLIGWALVASAYMWVHKLSQTPLENLGFLRRILWHNAGFGVLRGMGDHIDHTEPRHDPTVLPYRDEEEESDANGELITETSDDKYSSQLGTYSAAHYRALFLSGQLTPLDLVHGILPLIRRDTTPPGEHSLAWIDVNADIVIKAAEESTLRYKENRSLGPLDGVPTAVKDTYDVQGYKTTLGLAIDMANRDEAGETVDVWCVRKLKEAGAIILGKLSMHEIGMDTSGVNVAHGTPRNPYNNKYYTGGSSSGSAYAVATGLVPITMGSDGGGSIRIPASFCSVFGLKPTHGRLSYYPGHNASNTCEVNGLIANDIRSLATLFDVVSQQPPGSHFAAAPSRPLLLRAKRNKLLGIPEHWFQQATPAVQTLCRNMIQKLVGQHGYSIVPVEIPFVAEGQIAHALTIMTDAAAGVGDQTHLITPGNRILVSLANTTSATDYLLAQKLRRVLMQHMAHLWKEHPGMLIVTPTTACAGWPIRSEAELTHGVSDGDRTLEIMRYVWLANFCGMPSLSVPAGYVVPEGQTGAGDVAAAEAVGKVPVGMMATAEWTREDDLLRFGLDVEGLGPEPRVRPPTWVDTKGLVQKKK